MTKCTQVPNILSYIPSWQYHLSNWIIALHLFCPDPTMWSPRLWYDELYSYKSYLSTIIAIPSQWVCYFILLSSAASVSFEFNSHHILPTPIHTKYMHMHSHTHAHTHMHARTHTRYTHLSPPPHEPPIIHTHSVSVGVVPDRNKWQLPNYLLTVDVDAAWDALLIFFSLSLSLTLPPFYSFFFLLTSSAISPVVNYACPGTPNLHSYQPFWDQPPICSLRLSFSFLFRHNISTHLSPA